MKTVQTLVLDFCLLAISKAGDGGGPRCHVLYFQTHVRLSDSLLVHRPDGHGKFFSPKLIWTLDSCGTCHFQPRGKESNLHPHNSSPKARPIAATTCRLGTGVIQTQQCLTGTTSYESCYRFMHFSLPSG